ncbi:GPP34 family phosphoprotein [Nonomuraea mesophila]|uniref:GPP34 family phosphoprotein n=1 Tax=Nonomuraea mesophila TaxID=2530382 RepID=A0A4R5FW99_9ACTN|nr:GPP34 family phosphoprotein [Nonomuraea mesophila]TDE59090.1 GPP34 family phosphoprotein [Nonomuraea mesophila]
MNALPLHQDLYLIAHDQTGRPLIHLSSMALGLAGAVLLDLALGGRVTVAQGQAAATRSAPTGDAIADDLVSLLPRHRAGRELRYLLKKTADGIHDRTREALLGSGVLVQVSGRRLGVLPYTRYEPADIASVVRASAGARSAVEGWKQPDARCAALCGLVAVLRLEAELYLDQPSARLVGRLREIARDSSPVVGEVVTVVDALVGEAAVAVYR